MKKILLITLLILMTVSISAYAMPANVDGYTIPVGIRINDVPLKTPVQSFLVNGTVYVPVRAVCEAFGADVAWDENTQIATVTRQDVALKFSASVIEEGVHYAYLVNSSLCTPIRIIAEKFGFTVDWDGRFYNVLITSPDFTLPSTSVDTTAYSDEDILLLAKLIYAESGSCTFQEMLGIGGVVMNRIKSPSYPDTISGVIYDTKWSVQFPPAFDGSLDRDPSPYAIIAAKCVTHGVNVVGGSIGFTYTGDTTSWITQNLKLCVAFDSITFYE